MDIVKWFNEKFNSKKTTRRYIKDVKQGEMVQIEWYRIAVGIGYLTCLSNDPKTKKILLQVTWGNHAECGVPNKEKIIFNYNSKELKNFHLLNPNVILNEQEDDPFEIIKNKISVALKNEDYERVIKIQKQT